MKNCPNCKSEVDDHFELCWKCNYSFTEKEIVEIKEFYDWSAEKEINCLRCNIPMKYSGNFKFHEGTRAGVFGSVFELLQNRESFNLYHCSECGKVEFFTPKL